MYTGGASIGALHDFVSYIHEAIPEVIMIEKYYIKMDAILSSYRAAGRAN
jgi:hypothetical protein